MNGSGWGLGFCIIFRFCTLNTSRRLGYLVDTSDPIGTLAPVKSSYTLHLPDDMLGKVIEIIAFEIEEEGKNYTIKAISDKQKRLSQIDNLTKDKLVDLSNYKFNRDEANNYDQ